MITDAKWISSPADIGEICPIFSTGINTEKNVKNAVLSISATGVYEARINDERVGGFILAPGLTGYKSRLQYQTYDGKITSKWIYEGEGVRYEITTPVPSVVIISGKRREIDKGSYVFYE